MTLHAPRLAIALLLAAAPASAAPETVDEIRACMDENLPQDSSVQTIVLSARDRIGAVTRTRARIYWKRFEDDLSRVLVRFSHPPDMRGSALLLIEKKGKKNDMFMYLPELDRVRRVTGHMMSGSMFGTDFSYEEFERLQGLSADDVRTERLEDAEVAGRAAWALQDVPREGLEAMPAYERTVTYVDRELCVPLVVEFYERGEKLRKRLVTDRATIQKSGTRNVPQRLEIHDLRDDTRTELLVESIELDADIAPRMFTTRFLETKAGRAF